MQLKKINPNLQKALIEHDFIEANEMQQGTFSTNQKRCRCSYPVHRRKRKIDHYCSKCNPTFGKADILMSPRALIIVEDKEKMLEMLERFSVLGKYTDLRVYGTHDKSDMDYDREPRFP